MSEDDQDAVASKIKDSGGQSQDEVDLPQKMHKTDQDDQDRYDFS